MYVYMCTHTHNHHIRHTYTYIRTYNSSCRMHAHNVFSDSLFSVSDKSSDFTATVHGCSFLSSSFVVHQQLHGSHECSELFVLHIFQITKPGNVESI